MIPQQATSRYVRNLIVKGRNDDFKIRSIVLESSFVQDVLIGHYYKVTIEYQSKRETWVGVTIEEAVTNCLYHAFGVTFR